MGNQNKSHLGRFRHIHVYFDIFRDIQACSGIIQAYSEPCVTLAYSKPEAYAEPYIQNSDIFRTLSNI